MSIGDGFDVRSLAVTYHEGHHLHAHTHPWGQLIYARSGVLHVSALDRVWVTPPTRAIWIPPSTEHQIDFKGEAALRTLYVSALVAEADASLRTLQRCFAEETGMTIENWRQKARLVHSAAALAEGATVLDAALASGYESASAFIAAFRKQFGMTPRRFRVASHGVEQGGMRS